MAEYKLLWWKKDINFWENCSRSPKGQRGYLWVFSNGLLQKLGVWHGY